MRLIALLVLVIGPGARADEPSREALIKEATRLFAEGEEHFSKGRFVQARTAFARAEGIHTKLGTGVSEELVELYSSLCAADQALGDDVRAVANGEKALKQAEQLFPESKYPDGHPLLASSRNNLAHALYRAGEVGRALKMHLTNLALMRRAYERSKAPDDRFRLAATLLNVALVEREFGELRRAMGHCQEALKEMEALYPVEKQPKGHLHLATAINNLADVQLLLGDHSAALTGFERATRMIGQLFNNEHPHYATSLNNQARVYQNLGDTTRALERQQEALRIFEKLFGKRPNGHPDLARSLNAVGTSLRHLGQYEKAIEFHQRGLEMRKALFPKGHVDVLESCTCLGVAQMWGGQNEAALATLGQAARLAEQLFPPEQFPDGHNDSLRVQHSTMMVLALLNRPDEALEVGRNVLEMRRRLFRHSDTDGRTVTINTERDLAAVYLRAGKPKEGLTLAADACDHCLKNVQFAATHLSESQVLMLLANWRSAIDIYLTASLLTGETGEVSYSRVWQIRSLGMRTMYRRREAAAIARMGRPELIQAWDRLQDVRGQIARVALQAQLAARQRDQRLTDLTEEKERLEREMARVLPAAPLATATPEALIRQLPDGVAFVDTMVYSDHRNGRQGAERLVAYVMTKGAKPARIELGLHAEIERAVRAWRQEIAEGRPERSSADVAARLWAPIANALPANTRTLYVAVDGTAALVPWPALPGRIPGRLLLEEFAGGIATIPHGPFLLEHLQQKKPPRGDGELLALGGVDYGAGSPYPPLPGTNDEVKLLRMLAGMRGVVALSGKEATSQRLCESLPKARTAHLATHGFFALDQLLEERSRLQRYQREATGSDATIAGHATRSPLAFTGLVLASASDPKSLDAVLTAEQIVDLPLQDLELCVLSACETGLGVTGDGEGVHGPVRAFHLAGCPNVVASLWKVNDAATAALMAKFYHEMWVKKKPPIEALREAQLTIYRHPELIPDLAGERGAVRVKEAVVVRAGEPSGVSRRVSDTKLWAAFVLSGVGK